MDDWPGELADIDLASCRINGKGSFLCLERGREQGFAISANRLWWKTANGLRASPQNSLPRA
jgi:hypothetical protein